MKELLTNFMFIILVRVKCLRSDIPAEYVVRSLHKVISCRVLLFIA